MNNLKIEQLKPHLLRGCFLLLATYTLILSLFLVSRPFVPKTEIAKAKFATLDSLRPKTWSYLSSVVDENKPYDRTMLKSFLRYFKAVDHEKPNLPEILGLQGFVHFHLHNNAKAIASYQKAIELAPDFFWFYHNLALIYLKDGQTDNAVAISLKAIKLNPAPTLQYMLKPSALHPALQTYAIPPSFNNNIPAFVKSGYANVIYVLRSALKQQGKESLLEQAGFNAESLPQTEPSLVVF